MDEAGANFLAETAEVSFGETGFKMTDLMFMATLRARARGVRQRVFRRETPEDPVIRWWTVIADVEG